MAEHGSSPARSRQQEILARLRLATEKRAAGIQATSMDSTFEDLMPRPALLHKGVSRRRSSEQDYRDLPSVQTGLYKSIDDDSNKNAEGSMHGPWTKGKAGGESGVDAFRALKGMWGGMLEPESLGPSAEVSRRTSIAVLDTPEEKRVLVTGTFSLGPFGDLRSGGKVNAPELSTYKEEGVFKGALGQELGSEKPAEFDLRAAKKSELARLLQSTRGQSTDGFPKCGAESANGAESFRSKNPSFESASEQKAEQGFGYGGRTSAMELPDNDLDAPQSASLLQDSVSESQAAGTLLTVNSNRASVLAQEETNFVRTNTGLREDNVQLKESGIYTTEGAFEATEKPEESADIRRRSYTVSGTGLWKRPLGPESQAASAYQQQKAAARASFSKVLNDFEFGGDETTGTACATNPPQSDKKEFELQKRLGDLAAPGSDRFGSCASTPLQPHVRRESFAFGGTGRGELLTPQSSATPTTFGRLPERYDGRARSSRFGDSPGGSTPGYDVSRGVDARFDDVSEIRIGADFDDVSIAGDVSRGVDDDGRAGSDAVFGDVSRAGNKAGYDDVSNSGDVRGDDDFVGGRTGDSSPSERGWRTEDETGKTDRWHSSNGASSAVPSKQNSRSSSQGVYDPEVFYAADVLGGSEQGQDGGEEKEKRVASLERAILGGPAPDSTDEKREESDAEEGKFRTGSGSKEESSFSGELSGIATTEEGLVRSPVKPDGARVGSIKSAALRKNEAREKERLTQQEGGLDRRRTENGKGNSTSPGRKMDATRSTGKENGQPKMTKVEPFRLSSGIGIRHRKETVRRQVQEEMQRKLTFKPKILRGSSIPGKTFRPHGEARIRQLARPRSALYEQYAREREQRENETMQSCSFRPSVSVDSGILANRNGRVDERLHNEWRRKATERERMRRAVEQAELEQCTFRPQISDVSELIAPEDRRPIYERFADIQRQKSEALARAREQLERAEGTFRPKINSRSERIASEMGLEEINVADRLTTFASTASLGRKLRCAEEREIERQEECPFRPEINPDTERILNGALYVPADGDFLTRQHLFNELKYQKNLELQHQKSAEFRFRPDIGDAEGILLQSGKRVGESKQELIERLACTDKERLEAIRQLKAEEHYSQFDFRPALNPISRLVGRQPSVELLHKDDRAKKKLEALRASAEEAQRRECTFQPELSRSFSEPSDSRRTTLLREPELISVRIQEQERDRLARIEAVRELQREQELEDCTFRPAINGTPPEATDHPVIVPGLGRYLELQEMSKRLRKEQEERERRAFLLEIPSNVSRHPTKPKPFRLHSGSEHRKAEVARRAEEEFEERCTFKPETNAGRTRKLVEQVLGK